MAAATKPGALPAGSLPRRARRVARRQADFGTPLCHDWFEGGNTPEDAAVFAKMFKEAGADVIDCSSVRCGRKKSRSTAASSRRPSRTKSATRSAFHNRRRSHFRGRPRQFDHLRRSRRSLRRGPSASRGSAWTLHEAARIGLSDIAWPKQYYSGKSQYETNLARAGQAAK